VEQKRPTFPHRALISKWLKLALAEGRPWIRSGTDDSILIVEPPAAISWFLASPTRCQLIPKELADMVAPPTVDPAPAPLQISAASESEHAPTPPRTELTLLTESQKRLGGRPPAVNWKMVSDEVIRLMGYHGDFSVDDAKWNAQARLEDLISDFCQRRFGKEVSPSTIRGHVSKALEGWRARTTET
jgi:hypothetical protein